MEKRDEVLSKIGAQFKDASGYQISDLDDVEFYWENDQLVSVFRPGIDTPFSPSFFNDFEMGSMGEKAIVINEEQDKENYSEPRPTTPVSERPTQPTTCVDEKSPIRNKNWEWSVLCLEKFVWINHITVTVYVI